MNSVRTHMCLYFELPPFDTKTDLLQVESIFEEIRTAFIENLDDLDWMDDETRTYAVKKAKAVDKMLGYPDYITDPVKLDEHYKNVRD